MTRDTLDVSALPSFAFGSRSILWWATLGLIAIEGTGFAMLGASYLHLRWRVPQWPPEVPPPDLIWGTLTTVVLLASAVPNALAKRAAEHLDLPGVRRWMLVCLAFAALFLVLRVLEFSTLNVWWDTNAYGSIVWTLMGMHTAHIATDIVDTVVLVAIVGLGPLDANRFVDVSENSFYWYFVVLSWMPIYALVYLAPRIL